MLFVISLEWRAETETHNRVATSKMASSMQDDALKNR
jgi:hypothetical protein